MKVSKKECIFYIMTGNCLESENCTLAHPKLRLTKKSKLKFKNNAFKPKKESKKLYECLCCKDNPYKCRSTSMCSQFGSCICLAQKEMDNMLHSQNYYQDIEEVCPCCKGNFFTCENNLCSNLGMCQCQMRKDIENNYKEPENDEKNYFIQESSNCGCCKGYVFNCQGKKCKNSCYCFM